MKKQVSLSEVLTGKPVVSKSRSKAQRAKSTTKVDDGKKSVDNEEVQVFRSRQIEPIGGERVEPVSLKSFLMSKPKQSPKTPMVISLDDDLEVGDAIVVDDGPITMNSKMMEPDNFKKTNLKDLFGNFEKKPGRKSNGQVDDDADIDRKPYDGYGSVQRFSAVSKLKELRPELFPKLQLIYDKSDLVAPKLPKPPFSLTLGQKTRSSGTITFGNDEYLTINGVDRELDRYVPELVTEVEDVVDLEMGSEEIPRHVSLLTDLLSPTTPREVLLEPSLKEDVFKWINDAFHKLKRPTTRKKLMKQTKRDKMRNELEEFIVPDSMIFGGDDDDLVNDDRRPDDFAGEIEFVPLMILHGEGIGKNTLIRTISNTLNCQIYEINSSSNRGKKEILDVLLEFSTTHYVKGAKDGIILIDDVDVVFHEHDKFLWQALERVLLVSRRPVILTCRDINYIPTYLIDVAEEEQSIYAARKVSKATVRTLLTRHLQTLNLNLSDAQLDNLMNIHGADIRGCLMDLQLYDHGIKDIATPSIDCSPTFEGMAQQFELESFADVLSNTNSRNSSFKEDIDTTLMSRQAMEYVKKQTDDQLKLQHDYMVDYQLHLLDLLYNPLQPFELDIGQQLMNGTSGSRNIKKRIKKSKKNRIDKVVDVSASYLSSRVDPRQSNGNERSSRNSRRRIREVLERLDSNYESYTESEQEIKMDLDLHKYSTLAQEINPYILEIAKCDNEVKVYNRQLFETETVGLSKDQMNAVVYRLTDEGLLKPIFFKSNPKDVLDCWK
ncbi:Telomere length regulation protein ELG1 [Nakaseomyces bracarensis]|uniref:Telomere length regulation protein ELG1 n=1 Tax=Nakaseomyces bracarensis TaxID=273131 RepID=A0ABR4NWQ0_9SACH